MRKTGIIFAAIIFAFVATGSAFAWGPGQGKCRNEGPNQEGYKGSYEWGAKLTDEQKQQMKELHDKFVDETADLRININAKSEKIRILMETSNPDAGELKSLVKDIADLKGQLMAKRVDFYLDAKKIAPDARMGKWLHGGDKWGMGARLSWKRRSRRILRTELIICKGGDWSVRPLYFYRFDTGQPSRLPLLFNTLPVHDQSCCTPSIYLCGSDTMPCLAPVAGYKYIVYGSIVRYFLPLIRRQIKAVHNTAFVHRISFYGMGRERIFFFYIIRICKFRYYLCRKGYEFFCFLILHFIIGITLILGPGIDAGIGIEHHH